MANMNRINLSGLMLGINAAGNEKCLVIRYLDTICFVFDFDDKKRIIKLNDDFTLLSDFKLDKVHYHMWEAEVELDYYAPEWSVEVNTLLWLPEEDNREALDMIHNYGKDKSVHYTQFRNNVQVNKYYSEEYVG